MDIFIVETWFKNKEVDSSPWNKAVEALVHALDRCEAVSRILHFLVVLDQQVLKLLQGHSRAPNVRIVSTGLAFESLMSAMHVSSSLLMANVALQFFVLILSTLVAKTEVFREWIVAIRDVCSSLDIFLAVVLICSTAFAFETKITFPLLWDMLD